MLQPSKKAHQRLFQVNGSQNNVLGGGPPLKLLKSKIFLCIKTKNYEKVWMMKELF